MKRLCALFLFLSLFLCLLGDDALAAPDVYGPAAKLPHVRFYNGSICTLENGAKVFQGELWTSGDRVLYAGPAKTANLKFDKEIDLKGNLVMPGFKNGHAHSPMTFLRSYAEDLPLDRWLNEKVFPMEAKLVSGDIGPLYKLAVLEYLASGITAAFDMYMFTDEMCRAAAECGFRGVFCGSLNDFSQSLESMERQYRELNALSPLVKYHLGFHAEYTTSETLLKGVVALSKKYRAPVYFHGSETASEVQDCVERRGMTPIAYLDDLGMLSRGGGVFHGVHLTQAELDILSRRGVGIVTNPGSNCKLSSGVAPVTKMVETGILVGIGTDGPASNNALDMFREMYLASMLQKVITGDPTALGAEEALLMATRGSARIMGLDDCLSLAPGMLADLVVIDLKQPNMQPQNDIVKNLVYASGKQNVILTMVGGRILYENGRYYIGERPENIYRKANEIVRRIAAQ